MTTTPTTAKAYRCESCGAALPSDKTTCDYCGSSHQLPAWPAVPPERPPEPAPKKLSAGRVGVLIAVALAGALAAWLILR